MKSFEKNEKILKKNEKFFEKKWKKMTTAKFYYNKSSGILRISSSISGTLPDWPWVQRTESATTGPWYRGSVRAVSVPSAKAVVCCHSRHFCWDWSVECLSDPSVAPWAPWTVPRRTLLWRGRWRAVSTRATTPHPQSPHPPTEQKRPLIQRHRDV